MKKLILFVGTMMLFALPFDLQAQTDNHSTTDHIKKGVKKGAQGVKKGVKRGANEVAQQASEAKSEVTDKEVENKMGPTGQDIFVDNNGRYYYIDDKGHRVYMNASELRDKQQKK